MLCMVYTHATNGVTPPPWKCTAGIYYWDAFPSFSSTGNRHNAAHYKSYWQYEWRVEQKLAFKNYLLQSNFKKYHDQEWKALSGTMHYLQFLKENLFTCGNQWPFYRISNAQRKSCNITAYLQKCREKPGHCSLHLRHGLPRSPSCVNSGLCKKE